MSTPIENRTRDLITSAIINFQPSIKLDSSITFEDVRSIIRIFMRKHPEIFWFSHQYLFNKESGILRFKYNLTKEKSDFFKDEIYKVINKDFQADYVRSLPESERLAYVYKWIANRTTYNKYSSFNQTIYSVLINRNSVCTGYAKTAQCLLGLVGIKSDLVFGKFHSDKFEYGRHCWNIVNIEGKWYHVDFCLADIELSHLLNDGEVQIKKDSLLWNYYGVTTDKILTNRSIEFVETLPPCTDFISDITDIKPLTPKEQLICCKSNSGMSALVCLNSFNKNTVIKLSKDMSISLLKNEARLLENLEGCKHIVKFYGWKANGLELEQLTPWSELLNSHYYNPNESDLRRVLIHLTQGLIECRDNGITYSDIHYNNVFVSKDGTYKWGDFGIAFPKQDYGRLPIEMLNNRGKAKGSYWFMSPETYHKNTFTEASAIYSVAMMGYFVMNNMRPPFWKNHVQAKEALSQRLHGRDIPTPIFADRYRELWIILQKALSFSEWNRPKSFENFLHLLDGNVLNHLDDNEMRLDDNLSDHFVPIGNYDLFATSDYCSYNLDFVDNIDLFSATTDVRWGDGNIHDSDSFACTSGMFENPIPCQTEVYETYAPQKGTDKIVSTAPSRRNKWWQFWINSSKSHDKSNDEDINPGNEISACVYAPAQIQANKTFIIRVYLYKPEEYEAVDSKVKEIDPKAQKKEYKPLDIPVKKHDKLTVQLKMSNGITLESDAKSVTWRDHYTDCSFIAKLVDSSINDVFGTAYISVNGIPAGELVFTIEVVDSQAKEFYARVETHRYNRIFISYSHADEAQVKGFAECCRALGKDYFFDRHSLGAGDIFKDKILDYINNADLFVLCWSKNAENSEWVKIEREHAISLIKEGKDNLRIYPLSLKPEAPLPSDMADKYNFASL